MGAENQVQKSIPFGGDLLMSMFCFHVQIKMACNTNHVL